MWDFWAVRCSVCEIFGMWDFRDVGCGMFVVWDGQDVGCRMFCQDVGCRFTKCQQPKAFTVKYYAKYLLRIMWIRFLKNILGGINCRFAL